MTRPRTSPSSRATLLCNRARSHSASSLPNAPPGRTVRALEEAATTSAAGKSYGIYKIMRAEEDLRARDRPREYNEGRQR